MAKYINNCFIKQSKYGIKFSGITEKVIEQIKEITNEKGYFRLEIKERKEADKNGNTHYLVVDEWQPKTGVTVEHEQQRQTLNNDEVPF